MKKRKNARMAQIRKLDRIFSKIMHNKMFKCERCGKTINLQIHHIIEKDTKNIELRFDEENIIMLCSGCHFWLHRHMILGVIFLIQKIGVKKIVMLLKKYLKPRVEVSLTDLEKELKEEIKNAN